MKKLETVFRDHVRRDLAKLEKEHAVFWEPLQQKTICGTPDYILCVRGLFIALELKSEIGVVSRLQDRKLKKIARAGGMGFVVRPSNWEPIRQYLENRAKGYDDDDQSDRDVEEESRDDAEGTLEEN